MYAAIVWQFFSFYLHSLENSICSRYILCSYFDIVVTLQKTVLITGYHGYFSPCSLTSLIDDGKKMKEKEKADF